MNAKSLFCFSLCAVLATCATRVRAAVDAANTADSARKGATRTADAGKPRLLILTDIGGDPDDQQSMIRLMLYANEFELEGLIATASGTPGELKNKVTQPQLIREIVEAYGKVHPNLLHHAEGYPAAQLLLARVKVGNSNRGREAVGQGADTEGSRWIVEVVDRPDPRPLNVAIWGGQTDLAQALWRVKQDRGPADLAGFIRKLRIYDIGDQDGIVNWIWQEFPGLFYIIGQAPVGRDKRDAVYRGLYLGGDEALVSRVWMETNIRQGHGPLGALYPPHTWTAPNPHSAIKEGDTPSWFFFLPNGLGDPDHPEWGGWGGRLTNSQARIFRDAHDTVGGIADARCTVWRWREHFQHDFAARLDWCATDDFKSANHNPIAVLNGDKTRRVLEVAAKPGETVMLSAAGSKDPDGNALSTAWSVYPEAETFRGEMKLSAASGETTSFVVPAVQQSQTIHVILQIADNGTPKLWSYRRAVVNIRPPEFAGIVLGLDGTVFTLNGKKTFLLGASYYGALGAPNEFIARDLDDLQTLGFNWIRVWAVWDMFDNNVSAVDSSGNAREPYLSKLNAIVTAAEKRGMVVDVTLARMLPCLPNQEAHLRAVETLAKALKGRRNVYFDLANERDQNYAGGTFVSYAELKALRDCVKAADPDRLVTASGEPKDRADLARYLVEAGLDFISPHLNRDAGTEQRTADATRKFLGWMKELGQVAPIHYQEPFRRDYLDYRGFWQPEVETFCTDLRNAKLGGASGWCFHNGSPTHPERFPASKRRSFDLQRSQGRLMDQLDAVEREFLKRAASCAQ